MQIATLFRLQRAMQVFRVVRGAVNAGSLLWPLVGGSVLGAAAAIRTYFDNAPWFITALAGLMGFSIGALAIAGIVVATQKVAAVVDPKRHQRKVFNDLMAEGNGMLMQLKAGGAIRVFEYDEQVRPMLRTEDDFVNEWAVRTAGALNGNRLSEWESYFLSCCEVDAVAQLECLLERLRHIHLQI